ncbi:MAG: 39S ribosomal protein L44, mitochondrial [Lichina confinis]|nr:MAG: 39S ribosomal protein L44, mitochondrial [Lichina confinis]
MITRFLTDVTTSFNPFLHGSKTARLFLAFLPADARKTMRINTKLLPRSSREASQLQLKFKDGKEMSLDVEKLSVRDIIEEVDRHSRVLNREAALSGN